MKHRVVVPKNVERGQRNYVFLFKRYLRECITDNDSEIEEIISRYRTFSGYLKSESLRKALIERLKGDKILLNNLN